ncbi:MAG TPA: alpha-E domain-containing protein [Steroidobacteraceae bacterium]|nr:alpha-E domain-containing protein [Steroidobacteraceae bacterium]
MLARTVENVYWLSRYLERAENTARIIGVNTNLLLDLPGGIAPGWLPLVDISGNRAEYDRLHEGKATRGEERDVVQFLLADRTNPGSICSSLHSARENARTLREILPTEAWELLNQFFADFTRDLPTGINKRARFEFLKRIVVTLQTIAGMLDGTMNRNDAHTFSVLGRNLERADMTSRIVDVRSAQLLPAETPELRPFETVQWMSVLKSLSGYQMYRLRMRTRVKRTDVLQFLLRDDQFPRSCQFCLSQLERALNELPRSESVLEVLAGAARFIERAPLATLDQPGLHDLIDRLQLHVNNVHDMIAEIYFPSRMDGMRRMPSQAQGQNQSQRQSSLSFGETAKA